MTVYNPKPIFLDPRIEYGEAITKTLNAKDWKRCFSWLRIA